MAEPFVKLQRKTLEWRYADNPYAFSIWIHIIMMANWKDGWFLGKRVPRGSLAISTQNLADACGVSRRTVQRWLKRFEADGQITVEVSNRFTLINVINYAFFQDYNPDGFQQELQQELQQEYQQGFQQGFHNRRSKEVKKERREEREGTASGSPSCLPSDSDNSIPSLDDVKAYCSQRGNTINPCKFYDYYSKKKWRAGKHMIDWKAKVREWEQTEMLTPRPSPVPAQTNNYERPYGQYDPLTSRRPGESTESWARRMAIERGIDPDEDDDEWNDLEDDHES